MNSTSVQFRIFAAWVLAATAVVALLMSMTPLAFAATGGPTVTLTTTSPTSTSASSIPVTATFSHAVNGFTANDIATHNATVTNFTGSASSTTFTFSIMPDAVGSTTVQVPADVASSTAASSTGNQASNILTFMSTSASTSTATTTPPTSTSTPLALNSVTTVRSNAIADNTFTNGWQWTLHFTVPTTENSFRMKFSDFSNGSSSIPTASNIRIFSPQSSNATAEGSAITETNNNYSDALLLTGDTSASTAGRQIDLTVEVRIPTGTAAGTYSTTFGAQSLPASSSATSTATTTPVTSAVSINNMAFSPATTTVHVGDTVKWTNNDSTAHTVTSDTSGQFDSGTIAIGGTYSHTFTSAGTYQYHCTIHPTMHGTVVVTQ